MWTLRIGTFKKGLNGTHECINMSEPIEFRNRREAESYMVDFVEANTDDALKFLGFLDSPHGMHDTLDPTMMFWNNFHLAI